MPLIGPIPEGRTFFCPHCGALYSVTDSRLAKSNTEKCVVCWQIMDKGGSTSIQFTNLFIGLKMPDHLNVCSSYQKFRQRFPRLGRPETPWRWQRTISPASRDTEVPNYRESKPGDLNPNG
jgi:hypothetical protein